MQQNLSYTFGEETYTKHNTKEIMSHVNLPEQTNEQKNTSREREHQEESSGKQLERQGMARLLCCSPPVGDDTAVSLPLFLHSFVRKDKPLHHTSQKVQRNLR